MDNVPIATKLAMIDLNWFGKAQLGNCHVDPYFRPEACLLLRI
jgi:hypothetical protein